MNEHDKLVLSRIDTYISGVNTKGGFIVAFCTFILGSVLTKYPDLKPLITESNFCCLISVFLFILLLLCLVSVFFVCMAVFPYLKAKPSSNAAYKSLIFFISIANFKSSDDFIEAANMQNNDDVDYDIKSQIYVLSKGLKAKFRYIRIAMWLFFINLLLISSITILIQF